MEQNIGRNGVDRGNYVRKENAEVIIVFIQRNPAARRVGYVEPIITQPLCLRCHGDSIDEATRAAIAERYPDDEAVGFERDELRGLFWVELASD